MPNGVGLWLTWRAHVFFSNPSNDAGTHSLNSEAVYVAGPGSCAVLDLQDLTCHCFYL